MYKTGILYNKRLQKANTIKSRPSRGFSLEIPEKRGRSEKDTETDKNKAEVNPPPKYTTVA